MAKKLNKLQKSSRILEDAKEMQWCYVDTDNEFTFSNTLYVIDDCVAEYKVHNKAGTTEDFTNEAYMEEILVVINNDNNIAFYNQNYDLIESKYIKITTTKK